MFIIDYNNLQKGLFQISSEILNMAWSPKVYESVRSQLDYFGRIHNSRHIVIFDQRIGSAKILTRADI